MSVRFLIVGAGAIGGLFGGRLADAGRDVTFLVRPKRAEALVRDGLRISSPLGDLKLNPELVTAEDIHGAYDVVFLSVMGFALSSAMNDIAPAIGPRTAILPVLNGMMHMDRLTERFGKGAVIGGACRAVVQQDADGHIRQLNPLQQIIYGELDGSRSERIMALDQAMQGVGFDATVSTQIIQDMWEKWVELASLGAATCLLRGTVGDIAAQPGGADVALAIFKACADIARACGYPPPPEFVARKSAAITQTGSGLASSMYRNLNAGLPVEVDSIVGDLISRGEAAGVSSPLLQAAFVNLRIYQAALARK